MFTGLPRIFSLEQKTGIELLIRLFFINSFASEVLKPREITGLFCFYNFSFSNVPEILKGILKGKF